MMIHFGELGNELDFDVILLFRIYVCACFVYGCRLLLLTNYSNTIRIVVCSLIILNCFFKFYVHAILCWGLARLPCLDFEKQFDTLDMEVKLNDCEL